MLAEPVDDLRELGVELQAAIATSTESIKGIKNPALQFRATKAVEHARYLFNSMAHTVHSIQAMSGFLREGLGLDMKTILSICTRNGQQEHLLRMTTRNAMELMNESIRRTLRELHDVNNEIQQEVTNGNK